MATALNRQGLPRKFGPSTIQPSPSIVGTFVRIVPVSPPKKCRYPPPTNFFPGGLSEKTSWVAIVLRFPELAGISA
jgi:hypothetical protein